MSNLSKNGWNYFINSHFRLRRVLAEVNILRGVHFPKIIASVRFSVSHFIGVECLARDTTKPPILQTQATTAFQGLRSICRRQILFPIRVRRAAGSLSGDAPKSPQNRDVRKPQVQIKMRPSVSGVRKSLTGGFCFSLGGLSKQMTLCAKMPISI